LVVNYESIAEEAAIPGNILRGAEFTVYNDMPLGPGAKKRFLQILPSCLRI
jgi:hypothetical protein